MKPKINLNMTGEHFQRKGEILNIELRRKLRCLEGKPLTTRTIYYARALYKGNLI